MAAPGDARPSPPTSPPRRFFATHQPQLRQADASFRTPPSTPCLGRGAGQAGLGIAGPLRPRPRSPPVFFARVSAGGEATVRGVHVEVDDVLRQGPGAMWASWDAIKGAALSRAYLVANRVDPDRKPSPRRQCLGKPRGHTSGAQPGNGVSPQGPQVAHPHVTEERTHGNGTAAQSNAATAGSPMVRSPASYNENAMFVAPSGVRVQWAANFLCWSAGGNASWQRRRRAASRHVDRTGRTGQGVKKNPRRHVGPGGSNCLQLLPGVGWVLMRHPHGAGGFTGLRPPAHATMHFTQGGSRDVRVRPFLRRFSNAHFICCGGYFKLGSTTERV
ncbi:hypothetical protein Purlil1_12668 [Purpureocillium lilacinum]|uniref:Uncharacterized protein n=1 Tax=Purpureocillium lilacinum TaxID=33203 RepID=A0ABR0BG66_PURLI|nr:hypothetical protein Purlil1_12668 [Purpureocillium lilacinum]